MKRTIAAILAADVAGYSRLIAEDEDDTLRRLAEYSALFIAEVKQSGGRVFNTAGDAILSEFPSAVEALRAGIAIQQQLGVLNAEHPPGRRLQFRMGLTIGDVVQTDIGDLLGDAVNVAARLEGIAEPGGLCISRSVHEAIAARVSVAFRDLGPQRLKNIPRPVHAFRVILSPDGVDASAERGRARRKLALRALAALLVAGILTGAALLWFAGRKPVELTAEGRDGTDAAAQAAERSDLLSASVARPQRICFQDQVRLSGVLVPRREIDVGPDAEGLRIRRVLVGPMDDVAANQPLAELARPDRPDEVVAQIRAPSAGTISRATATAGALTAFRTPPLFQLVVQGEVEFAAEMPIRDIRKLASGQPVLVTPLGLPEIQGRLRSVSSAVDGQTQLGRARIGLRTNVKLNPGTFASGLVTIGERCSLGVAMSAITKGPEGTVVFVSNRGRVEGRLVTTGLTEGHAIEIRSGLDETDAVVTRAGPFVREGDVVRPVTVAADASQ